MPKRKYPSIFDNGVETLNNPDFMDTWQDILARLEKPITEAQLLAILSYEVQHEEPRETVVIRIHGRLSRMRAQRERQELLAYVGVEG